MQRRVPTLFLVDEMTFIFILWAVLALCAISVVFLVIRSGLAVSLQSVKDNAEPIKITLLVVVAVYTAAVFHVEMRDRRIANTLAFQQKAESGHVRKALMTIDMFWIRGKGRPVLDRFRTIEMYALRTDYLSKANLEWTTQARELVNELNYQHHIVTIFDFYRNIIVCVEQGRCHRGTACQLFATDIEDFRLNHRAFISEWGDLWGQKLTKSLMYFPSDCGIYETFGKHSCQRWHCGPMSMS